MSETLSSIVARIEHGDWPTRCGKSAKASLVAESEAGDWTDMDIGPYDGLMTHGALHGELLAGRLDVQNGRVRPAREALADLRAKFA